MRAIKVMLIALTCIFSLNSAYAEDLAVKAENKLKDYLNETNLKVQQAETPSQKRSILRNSFKRLDNVMHRLVNTPGVSEKELTAIQAFRANIREKADELDGINGYEPVPDSQLDTFANYAVQDLEQAERYITLSVTTALLIVIILLLIN